MAVKLLAKEMDQLALRLAGPLQPAVDLLLIALRHQVDGSRR